MKEILAKFDGVPGVRAALLMTLDGVVVAAAPAGAEQERTAAFLSAVLAGIEKSAETLGLVPFQRLTLTAEQGRLLLVPVGELALVVLADGASDLAPALAEVAGLTRRLLRQSKLDMPA